jgi:hypothetical protein
MYALQMMCSAGGKVSLNGECPEFTRLNAARGALIEVERARKVK